MSQTVRVIRTWNVEVDAEYGDTPESLCNKISEEQLDNTTPDAEARVLMPIEKANEPEVEETE